MADHRITDFVDQEAIDRLKELSAEMNTVKDTYLDVAKELLKGIRIKVDGLDDLERMTTALATQEQRASQASETLSRNLAEQGQIVANTTNTISRQLMEQEKLNEKNRTAYERYTQVHDILGQVMGDYQGYTARLAQIEISLGKINDKKRLEKESYEKGLISQKQYEANLAKLIEQHRQLTTEKSNLTHQMKMMEKEEQTAFTSYDAMSQQLAQMKRAYRELNEEGRKSEIGQTLLAEIKELSAHLKDLDASMGDFQRNVGDYAIACQNGVTNTEDLNRVLDMEAATIAGCIEQNKALEQAKSTLDTRDANYAQTLERVNAKIEDNRRRIADVDAILHKEATTVAEAESQNRQLTEALKLVDLNSAGAEKRIKELNDKIAENKRVIEQATPALNDHAKALEEQQKKSSDLVDKMLSLVGANNKFGSSLGSLSGAAEGGNVIQGLGVKVQAFGRTLMGLLANPMVLAFLGLVGVAAGFKWWYDYNKGLIEATRLTKDFTGKTGDDLKNFRSEVQGVADTFGKDFKEVLNATDTMAAQFGITFEEALDKIKGGFLADGDAQGDMLSNLERFAPAFYQAGVSASQFTAIVAQTRSGIFSTDGLTAMQTAFDRIRRMPKATKEAMQAIGVDTAKMQKDLNDGTISMLEAVQQVSSKLKDFPENSKAVGDVLFNVFGRKGPAAGLQMIQSIADINTNLDEEKKKLGDLADLKEKEMQSQIALDKTLAAVFDATGGSFESLITTCKVFINEGLIKIINGCVDIVNWWIRLYNQSKLVRYGFNSISVTFKNLWTVAKFVLNQIIDAFKALGDVIEGALTLDTDKIAAGYKRGLQALKANVKQLVSEIASTAGEAYQKVISDHMDEVEVNIGETVVSTDGTGHTSNGNKGRYTTDSESDAAAKAAAKKQKEEIKRQNAIDEARLKAMKDGHEKDMETIRVNYRKKMREITGNSEKETQTRRDLNAAMQRELDDCERKYQESKAKTDLDNRLAAAKKGSKEEFDLKSQKLQMERDTEIREAEKTGADVAIIRAKYAKQEQDLREEYASEIVAEIEKQYAAEQVIADNFYAKALADRKKQYVDELAAAGNNAAKRAEITAKYEDDVATITETAAIDTAMRQIEMIEKVLKTENLSADERAKIEGELAKAKITLEDQIADATNRANDEILKKDAKTTEKRIENAKRWLQVASDGLNAINDLASAIYDAKIQKVEEEQDALDEASEQEQERIDTLVEQNVISEEEGEARKRAAEERTAQKQEELEKKKQQLQYKQAIWDKVNSIAQIGISTALAIMTTSAQLGYPAAIPFVAAVGALGALQLATVLATPIPKYAKGTDYHRGGLAIVGDAGEHEIVSVGSKMYITPKTPTLVDMPQGAQVFPSINDFAAPNGFVVDTTQLPEMPQVIVNNDYRALQADVRELAFLIKQLTKQQHSDAYRAELDRWKLMKGL